MAAASSTLNTSASPKAENQGAGNASAQEQAELRLIQRVCDGERQCFYDIVQPYERGIYRAAFAILRNQQDAEDVAQEAMLKALTHLPSFRRESKFSTWLIQ